MKTVQKDKILSATFLLLSVVFILITVGQAEMSQSVPTHSFKEFLNYLVENYLDILLISYIFICLQVSGFVELKYKQNFITMSLVSIFLTPFALYFIVSNEK